jgi:hypothetical protein
MTIASHAQLLTAVSDYIGKRSDLGDVDDDFVVLAEARMNFGNYDVQFPSPPLRVRQMEERGVLSPTSEYTSLPSDYLEARYCKITSKSPDRALHAMPAAMFDRRLANNAAGTPLYYGIFGTELRINPVESVTLELGYYRTIPPLATNDPNWLLTANPALYLYAALLEAAIYIDEVEDIAKYGRLYGGLQVAMQATGSDSGRAMPLTMENAIRPVSGIIRA